MRNWAATIVLTSSWLLSGFIASEAWTSLVGNGVASSQSIAQLSETKPITATKAEFGVLRVDSKGQRKFTPTTRILLHQGGKYGWRIQLKNYKGKVTWREILRLPKPPETWATDDGQSLTLSADGIEAVTTRTEFTPDGHIENFWTMVPGDPGGKHQIEVYIDNRLIGSFNFEVISLKKN
ncbi:hypothetical protein [Umezakia ovalisporum]|jgi:hypothetical protein|uniref:Uncharacterized protein n=2 Tax=Umezakia ovalisporum TaxID=75695 RepID=A0AA43GYI9_9CYAN|nr:hypothetical protein [Umezakia ovalisporum]MBI1242728.1 hypothetical protein [Nostoc sp. RI_552]MDH6058411.1 hypothetical protein [Umezakia ovalisporum FSS-43]MDH6064176.1 hypothetical protein [Umezakia ovalisporum FSS-62]MDH6066362.1 hypothetical protein [Umezakia ovalisporum APH033B]MDH6070517.1 hypothetical protein [Umezakia ovalisporum CobakiLakeA]